ncbi:MgtC/SapB family protein [Candidatus Micrarchaeota archaeon]|nr:MgtC/SapB family protein [Candidatus Micrarchaeota archaeon]
MVFDFAVNALLALAAGGLIGLERERGISKPSLGMRTFAITAFLGFMLAYFGRAIGFELLFTGIGLLGVFALAAFYYNSRVRASYYARESIGLTTTMMIPFTFFLGILIGYGFRIEAGIAAIASVYLLVERREFHAIAKTISREEIIDLIIFAVIAFIIYPLLPPGEVTIFNLKFSLQYFWLIVVLVTSISFLSHLGLKYFHEKAVVYTSFIGGVLSSTATIVLFLNKKVGKNVFFTVFAVSSAGALLADMVMLEAVNQNMLLATLPFLAAQFAVLLAISYYYSKRLRESSETVPESKRFLSLKFVFEFAIIFFLISVLVNEGSTLNGWSGIGIILTALIGGLVSQTSVFAAVAYQNSIGAVDMQTSTLALLVSTISALAAKTILSALGLKRKDAATAIAIFALVSTATALGFLAFRQGL